MNIFIKIGIFSFILFSFSGCFPKMAETPKMGAEYEFQAGTKEHSSKKDKTIRRLFDEKTRKELVEKGELRRETGEKKGSLPSSQIKKSDTSELHTDSTDA